MRTTKPLILIAGTILTGILLYSCSPRLYPTQRVETEESVVEKEIIRDTIIQVQPDSSMIRALIQCDSTGRARLQEIQTLRESVRLQQSISIDPDPQPYKPTILTVQAKVDSMGIYLKYKERFKEETKTEIRETVIEKEVNVLTKMQRFLMDLGVFTLILIVATIARKLMMMYL